MLPEDVYLRMCLPSFCQSGVWLEGYNVPVLGDQANQGLKRPVTNEDHSVRQTRGPKVSHSKDPGKWKLGGNLHLARVPQRLADNP